MSFEHIEMMNDLLAKSKQIRQEQAKTTKLTKEQMIAQAKKKIEDYFRGLLEVLPVKEISVNVCDMEIKLKTENAYMQLKNDTSWDKASAIPTAFIIPNPKSYHPYEHTLLSEHEDAYYGGAGWGGSIKPLDENLIVRIVSQFDKIKVGVEQAITAKVNELIEENAKAVSKEVQKLDALQEFLAE